MRLRAAPDLGFFVLYRARHDEPFRAFARCADIAEALAVEAAMHAYESSITAAAVLPAGKAEVYARQIAERRVSP